MNSQLAQLTAAILGALAALCVVFITHYTTQARSLKDKLLSKLEELLTEVIKFSRQTQRLYDMSLDAHHLSDAEEDRRSIRDLREERLETHSKIQMLVSLYFPELQGQMKALWTPMQKMESIAYAAGDAEFNQEELQEAFVSTMLGISDLRVTATAAGNRLTGRPNPSIERTLPGKPVSASHVKR
jgi:hypothetical protein